MCILKTKGSTKEPVLRQMRKTTKRPLFRSDQKICTIPRGKGKLTWLHCLSQRKINECSDIFYRDLKNENYINTRKREWPNIRVTNLE